MSHDSYTCRKFPDTQAFPTKREAGVGNYVGSVVRDTFQIELSSLPIGRVIRFLNYLATYQGGGGITRSQGLSNNGQSSALESQFGRAIKHIRPVGDGWRHMPDQVQAA